MQKVKISKTKIQNTFGRKISLKTKSILVIFLIGILFFGFGISTALATHTHEASISPVLATGGTSTIFTVTITNASSSSDKIEWVRITWPTSFSSGSCDAIPPVGWSFEEDHSLYCKYYTGYNFIATGTSQAFDVTVTTATSSGTYIWGTKTQDIPDDFYTQAPTSTVDAIAPTATVTIGTATIFDSDLIQEVTVDYSEAMNTSTTPTVTFTGGTWAAVTGSWASSTQYNASSTITSDGETITNATATVTGATDVAGNAPAFAADNFDVDTENPTVTNVTPANLIDVNVGIVSVSILFAEEMDGTTNPIVIVEGITSTSTVVATTTPWSNGTTTWSGTFTLSDDSEEVTTAYYAISGGKDAAGNTMVALASRLANNSLNVDTLAPTVTITDDEDGVVNIADGDITYTFEFSQAVTGFEIGDITVSAGGTKGAFTASSTTQYTLAVTPAASSTASITVDVNADVAADANNNPNFAAAQSIQEVDTLKPTVTITDDEEALKIGETATITFTTSEVPTGFNKTDVTVTGGTISDFTGTGPYAAIFTPTNDNVTAATFDVDAGKFTDPNGNFNATATQETMTIDLIAPTGTVTIGTATIYDGDLIQEVTVNYDEAMDITDAGEEVTNATATVSGGTDAAGNAPIASVIGGFAVDTKNPTMDSAVPVNQTTINVTFSEPIKASTVAAGAAGDFFINTATGGQWPNSAAVAGSVVTLTTSQSFTFTDLTTVELVAGQSVADLNGNSLNGLKTIAITGTSTLTVSSIAVTPSSATIAKGETQQFVATVTYTNGTTATVTAVWISSNTGAVTIVADTGVATGVTQGSTVITATKDGKSGTANLTVTSAYLSSIAVTPTSPANLSIGSIQQFTAMGTYSDNSTSTITSQVDWASSDTGKATISDGTGIAIGVAAGTTTITAAMSSKTSTAVTLTVVAETLSSITVTPSFPTVSKSAIVTFVATGVYSGGYTANLTASSTWTSSDATIAAVPNSNGTTSALAIGSTEIKASYGGITSAAVTLTVTNATLNSITVSTSSSATIPIGNTENLSAAAAYSDSTIQYVTTGAVWTSANTSIATVVSNSGVVTGVLAGTTTITATYLGQTDSITITVTAETLFSITVTPSSANVSKGGAQQFVAVATYSNGTTATVTADWISSNTDTATVNANSGLAAAVAEGSTVITATKDGKSGTATLTVTGATLYSITVAPNTASVAKGLTQQYVATAIYLDETTKIVTSEVTWSVTSGSSTIDAYGLATTKDEANSSSEIKAVYLSKEATATLTTLVPAIVSITVTPTTPTITKGDGITFVATGIYTDLSTADLTGTATWISSDDTVAATPVAGVVAEGLKVGSATITATAEGKSGSTVLTVYDAILSSIAIIPLSPDNLPIGSTQQFTAMGTYSDNSTAAITSQVDWTSSNTDKATIVDGTGIATGVAEGTTDITAAMSGTTSNTIILTVVAKTLSSITVAPVTPTITEGTTITFNATGTYTDSSTDDLTALVAWSSSDTTIAAAPNSNGTTSALAMGFTEIRASYGGVTSAAVTLTVNAAPVTPGLPAADFGSGIYNGTTTVQLTANNGTGIYYTTDGSAPDNTDTLYTTAGIQITSDTTLKAIAYNGLNKTSDVAAFYYIIKAGIDLTGPDSHTITLVPGWNIFSIPKVASSSNWDDLQLGDGAVYVLVAGEWQAYAAAKAAFHSSVDFAPLYGYAVNNASGTQTLTITYKTSPTNTEKLFSRFFQTTALVKSSGWYSIGVASPEKALVQNNALTIGVDTSDLIYRQPGTIIAQIIDYTGNANSSTTAFAADSNNYINRVTAGDSGNLINPRETRGYIVYINVDNGGISGNQR